MFQWPAQDIGKPAIAAFEGVMFRVLFYFGKRQQIFNDCRKTVDLSGDDAEEPLGINAVFHGPARSVSTNPLIDVAACEARGNIGHKIFSHVLELFELRDIIKDQERTYSFFLAVAKRASMELKNTLGVRGLSRRASIRTVSVSINPDAERVLQKNPGFHRCGALRLPFTDRTPLIDAESMPAPG